MAAATERIVVQITPQDKKALTAKAKKLEIPVSELMRRAAFAYESDQAEGDLAVLADAARGAAERAGAAIDGALAFIEASNRRMASMEAKAARARGAAARKAA
jgi:hypothetical protein